MPFKTSLKPHIKLWQAAETYLNVGKKTRKVTKTHGRSFTVINGERKSSTCLTVLKIISYVSIVLPLLALAIRGIYRCHYKGRVLSIKTAPTGKTAQEKIKHFIDAYESKHLNDLKAVELKQHNKAKDLPNLDHEQALSALDKMLKDKKTYTQSGKQSTAIIQQALQVTLDQPLLAKNLQFARNVYKRVSAFLRKNTDKQYLSKYESYLKNDLFEAFTITSKPSSYLSPEHFHALNVFLLKRLRKQIKLAAKREKIIAEAKKNLGNTPNIDKAISLLALNWMHGTKATVIVTACENTEKTLLSTGELKKRKVKIFTGEMDIGSSAIGINQSSLSGVNLPFADTAVTYAKSYTFKLEDEKKFSHRFFERKFEHLHDFLDSGDFSREVVALERLKQLKPELFEREKIAQKIQSLYTGLQKVIFEKEPREIYKWYNDYYTSKYYAFLKSLHHLEALLNAPALEAPPTQSYEDLEALGKIPIVFASTNKVGMPAGISSRNEPSEETYPGGLLLGQDIDYIFTEEEHLKTAQDLLDKYGLTKTVKVESMELLMLASKIDQILGPYLYDFYGVNKWRAI